MPPSVSPSQVDDLVRSTLAEWEIPGLGLVIATADEVLHAAGYGVKELGRPDPVTPDSLFAIASTTKAFTTCAIAMLVDEGRMGWDDPVRRHLPWFRLKDPLADAEVRIRDLLCHRTGMPRHDMLWYRSPWTREEIARAQADAPPSAGFRERYQYTNNMYMVAGLALEAASGLSWEEFVRARIFEPLGMRGANLTWEAACASPDRATPHRATRTRPPHPIEWLNFDAEGPGGTINAGPRDMGRWLRFQLGRGELAGRRLVSRENLEVTRTPHIPVPPEGLEAEIRERSGTVQVSYGLGWSIWDYRGHAVLSHNGAIDGFRATVALAPRHDLGIGVFVNRGLTRGHEALRNLLLDRLLGLPPLDWHGFLKDVLDRTTAEEQRKRHERADKRVPDTRPSRPLSAYTGSYRNPAYRTARVEEEGEGLALSWSTFRFPLRHRHFDQFEVEDEDTEVESQVCFSLDGEGQVVRLTLFDQVFEREPGG